jgi:hypothetical protein
MRSARRQAYALFRAQETKVLMVIGQLVPRGAAARDNVDPLKVTPAEYAAEAWPCRWHGRLIFDDTRRGDA